MPWGQEGIETEVNSSLAQHQTLTTDLSLIFSLLYFPLGDISPKSSFNGKQTYFKRSLFPFAFFMNCQNV